MSNSMSQKFVTSFLSTCFEAGLNQEAAAALLQKESADQVKRIHPGFARGYDGAMKSAGVLPPMLNGSMVKEASWFNSIMKILRGMRTTAGGVGGLAGQAGKDVSRAGRAVLGPKNPRSLLNQYPFPTFMAGTGLAAGGTLLGMHMLKGDSDLYGGPGQRPFFPPSGYSPSQYKKRYDDELYNSVGPGISQHNKNYFGTYSRQKELQRAVDENRDPTGTAYRELQHLKHRGEADGKAREGFFDQLRDNESYQDNRLRNINERRSELESDRTSIWGLPRRTWEMIKGNNPRDYYDSRIGALSGAGADARRERDIAADSTRMMEGGYVGRRDPQPAADANTLRQRFFPSD